MGQVQAGHKRENVQRDILKYTAQKIKYDLLKNNPQLEITVKDRKYPFWEHNPLSIL